MWSTLRCTSRPFVMAGGPVATICLIAASMSPSRLVKYWVRITLSAAVPTEEMSDARFDDRISSEPFQVRTALHTTETNRFGLVDGRSPVVDRAHAPAVRSRHTPRMRVG